MPNLPLETCIDDYMYYCQSRQLSKKTMLSYEQTLKLFQRWCAEQLDITDVGKITERTIRRYIVSLQERGKYTYCANDKSKSINHPENRRDFRQKVSSITINNYLRNLRAFFNWLYEETAIDHNPMKKIKPLKCQRAPKEYLDDEQFSRLVGVLDLSYFSEYRDYVMIMLMLDTGMRLGECSCLSIRNLKLSDRTLCLDAAITKGRKDRVVFFSKKTEAILRKWFKYKDRYIETNYLFPVKASGDPICISNFETNFKKYLRRASVPETTTPHCLRNNFAKRCLMSGMDIYTLSRILGHSSVKVTEEAYLDLTDDDIRKTYQQYSPISNMHSW